MLEFPTHVDKVKPANTWANRPKLVITKPSPTHTIVRGDAERMIASMALAASCWHGMQGQGCETEAAATLAERGWDEAAVHARALFQHVTALRTRTFPNMLTMSDEPGDIDVAAALANSDTPFLSTAPDMRASAIGAGTVVRVEHDMFISAASSTNDIVKRGVIVAGMIYVLERAGQRVELVLKMKGVVQKGAVCGTWDVAITVKSAWQRVDLARILYWLAHPSPLRVGLHAIGYQRKELGHDRNGFFRERWEPSPGAIKTPDLHADTRDWMERTLTGIGFKVSGGAK